MADETQVQETTTQETGSEPEVTLESLSADNAKLRAEMAKQKIALDKALHNNGELTKQLRAKMTAQEQEDEAKRVEAEAVKSHIAELEAFKHEAEAKERYLTMGMSRDFAIEAAKAEVAGDMDALAAVYKKHNDASIKAKQEEWLKTRPEPAAGKEENAAKDDPFLAGFLKG